MPDVLKTVGRYEILREVGRGGMAMVYLARQTDLDRFVALKELAAFHASDAAFAQRFLRESRVAGSLSHPNIVTVHDYFEHDGTPYIAMEYVERGSLRPFVGRMSLAQVGGVLEGLLAGLAQAEQHGIVHRDLKPENLMVTSDGRVKIADFGIAKATNQMQTGAFLTATGTTVGTPTYMAPEQAMAQDIGPWTDLYSVGCMAFELFTGRVPFHDSDAPMAILLRHVNEQIPPVRSIEPSVDHGVSDWVEQLLVKDPKARTQSANEAWDELEELIIGLLGPRWRRAARLSVPAEQRDTPKPLTPAPFEGASSASGGVASTPGETGGGTSDEFQSFVWGEPVPDTPPEGTAAPPGPATPPPAHAPAGPLEPGPIDVPTGPPTPPPLEPVQESGFVTFGAPQPAPPVAPSEPVPSEAASPRAVPSESVPPAGASPPDAALPAEAAPPVAGPPAGAVEAPLGVAPSDAVEAEPGFDTYVPPPPPRPPTDEPAAETPALPVESAPASAPSAPAPAPPAPAPAPPAPAPAPSTPTPAPSTAASAPPASGPSTPVAAAAAADPGATVMPEALKRARESEGVPAEPREPSRRAFPVALGVGAVVAVIAGMVLGGGGADGDGEAGGARPTGVPVSAAASGGVRLKVPAGYAELASAPAMPGLELVDDAAYAPGGEDGGRAVMFGQAEVNDSTLLPADFRTALGLGPGGVPERTAVKLGPDGLEAYRYEGLESAGSSRRVTVYASPTSKGVATVACLAPPADAGAFKSECEAIADTLQVDAPKTFPVGPDPAYARTLGAALSKLGARVAKGREALAGKQATFTAQARAARDIQGAYIAAAQRLERTETSPADRTINDAVVARLDDAAAPWKQAAAAAARKDKRAFARSEGAIKRTQGRLAQTVAGLEAAGYNVSE